MTLSVGYLYSSIKLLEIIIDKPINSTFIEKTEKLYLSPISDLLNLSDRCDWISINSRGFFEITNKGKRITELKSDEEKLRYLLRDIIITYQPPWCKSITYGRREFERSVSREISQCFRESGLLQSNPNDSIIECWDELAILSKGFRNIDLMKLGRKGEKYTLIYERERTGSEPIWQSLESNFSGFDILSIVEESDTSKLQIEVKATSLKLKDAKFHLTCNEWKNAQVASNFMFYLWILNDNIRLAKVGIQDIEIHIPNNKGNGQWEIVEIPMAVFKGKFKSVEIY